MSEKERYDDPRATELRVTKNSSSSPGNNRREFIHISTLLGTATVFGEVAEPSKAETRNIPSRMTWPYLDGKYMKIHPQQFLLFSYSH